MIRVPDNKDIPQLKKIWAECFGDEDEYISLFFEAEFSRSMSLAYYEDDMAVAVLYRLPCNIRVNRKSFHGRYIYAAATLPEYRKRGIMGKLLNSATLEAEKATEFIALVPGTQELYNYYVRFGYRTAMFRATVAITNDGEAEGSFYNISVDEYCLFKADYLKDTDCFIWDTRGTGYALKCIEYFGGQTVSDGVSAAVISVCDTTLTVHELLSAEPEITAKKLMSFWDCKDCVLYTTLGSFEAGRFGMINPAGSGISEYLNDAEIYMNLALN